jgi:NADH dehydrogenase
VVLIEGTERVLPPYPPELSEKARLQLERLGVTVLLKQRTTAVDADGVSVGNVRIAAKTVIWAAGVKCSPLTAMLGVPLDRAGRVKVDPDLSLPGHPEVCVIGDLVAMEGVPGIAPAAKQMGRYAASAIKNSLHGKKTEAFRYRDYGQLATIGPTSAGSGSQATRPGSSG